MMDDYVSIFMQKNKFRRSHNGDIVLCGKTNTKYAITGTEQTIEDVFRYTISKPVHTHPENDVKFDSISTQGIKGYDLALSRDFDIKNLVETNLSSGYILSKKTTETQGYVFEYTSNSLEINIYCPIIGRF